VRLPPPTHLVGITSRFDRTCRAGPDESFRVTDRCVIVNPDPSGLRTSPVVRMERVRLCRPAVGDGFADESRYFFSKLWIWSCSQRIVDGGERHPERDPDRRLEDLLVIEARVA